jgi:penicillin-binding protein 2
MKPDNINQKFTRRALILMYLKGLLSLILGINIYNIQILSGNKYTVLSDKNRIRVNFLEPQRGLIVDRNGEVIVDNNVLYTASIATEAYKDIDSILKELKPICQTLPIKSNNQSQIVLCTNLQWDQVAKIESNITINQIVRINQSHKRVYLYNNLLSYITGYIGIPSKKDVENNPNINDFAVGKDGLEMSCEDNLKGTYGIQKVEVNAFGKEVREISTQHSIPGQIVKTSIDLKLQQKIAEINGDNRGIHIAIDLKAGEILAMYSSPGYDPNLFTDGIQSKEWNKLMRDPEKPLLNKSILSLYPPGSTFKMITLLSILKSGIKANESVLCTGEINIGRRVFHCWKKYGHGYVNGYTALENSCNIYFATQGMKAGIDIMSSVAKIFGIGMKTDIELPSESTGLMPTKQWKKAKKNQVWTFGDTVNVSIGQGDILTTPIQLAIMTARIATGKFIKPTLLCNQNNSFKSIDAINSLHLQMVRDSMYNVMKNHHWENLKIAGKTGTAQVISKRDATGKFKDHSMFVGFAPYDKPKYAVVSIAENAGWGADTALPMTKKIFRELL